MKLSDLIIIYLACGSPFAVYFYLQNRQRLFSRHLILKTVLNFIFWIPFSLQILGKLFSSKRLKLKTSASGVEFRDTDFLLNSQQKRLEQIISDLDETVNIYETREIINRYCGLTAEIRKAESRRQPAQLELFRVAGIENGATGTICLQRRNRQRLLYHQKQAAADFVQLIFEHSGNSQKIVRAAHDLCEILNDNAVQMQFLDLAARSQQRVSKNTVNNAEKILWKSTGRKLPNVEKFSIK